MGMQKKLDDARNQGFLEGLQSAQKEVQNVWLDGIKVGAEAANEAWIAAMLNTKGIGDVLRQRVLDEAKRQHDERVADRKKLIEATEGMMTNAGSGTEHQNSSNKAVGA